MEVDKLDLLLEKVDRIEKKIFPPAWKRIMTWIMSNFITIAFLVFIAWIVWRVWGIVTDVKEFTINFDDNIAVFFQEQFEKVKFW